MVKLMQRYLIGKFQEEQQVDADYEAWNWLLQKLIFICAILGIQYDHPVEKRLGILFAGQAHTHFVQEHLATIIAAIPQPKEAQNDLTGLEAWHHLRQMEFVTNQDIRVLFPPEKMAHLERIAHWFGQEDLQLLDSLIEFTLNVMREGKYNDALLAEECADLVANWLNNHLRMIEHIAEHVEGLFRSNVDDPHQAHPEQMLAMRHGFSCPIVKNTALVGVG